jgi:hypothetical protein
LSEIDLICTAPIPPFSLVKDRYFICFWRKISGAQWQFNIEEGSISIRIVLPTPTTDELEMIVGPDSILKMDPFHLSWEIAVPENIRLMTDPDRCVPFKVGSFIGIKAPIQTVHKSVVLNVE